MDIIGGTDSYSLHFGYKVFQDESSSTILSQGDSVKPLQITLPLEEVIDGDCWECENDRAQTVSFCLMASITFILSMIAF